MFQRRCRGQPRDSHGISTAQHRRMRTRLGVRFYALPVFLKLFCAILVISRHWVNNGEVFDTVVEKYLMRKERIPVRFLYTLITGAVGKEFVIKHYKYGVVKTKYPDMTKIVASAAQRSCRDKFRDAVAYAKNVMADPIQKEAWRKKVRIKSYVFVRIVRHYLLELKEAEIKRRNATERLLHRCFNKENKQSIKNYISHTVQNNRNTGKSMQQTLAGRKKEWTPPVLIPMDNYYIASESPDVLKNHIP